MSCFFARRAVSAQSCAFANLQPWGRCPQTPGVFRIGPMGLLRRVSRPGGKPCRNTEASAPLATSAAPVALRQSRILRTMQELAILAAQTKGKTLQQQRNPVLNHRCLVLNRRCIVLFRHRHPEKGFLRLVTVLVLQNINRFLGLLLDFFTFFRSWLDFF